MKEWMNGMNEWMNEWNEMIQGAPENWAKSQISLAYRLSPLIILVSAYTQV